MCVSVGLEQSVPFRGALFPPSNFQKPRTHSTEIGNIHNDNGRGKMLESTPQPSWVLTTRIPALEPQESRTAGSGSHPRRREIPTQDPVRSVDSMKLKSTKGATGGGRKDWSTQTPKAISCKNKFHSHPRSPQCPSMPQLPPTSGLFLGSTDSWRQEGGISLPDMLLLALGVQGG